MLIVFEGKDLPPECDSIAGGSGFCVAKDERGLAGEASIETSRKPLCLAYAQLLPLKRGVKKDPLYQRGMSFVE